MLVTFQKTMHTKIIGQPQLRSNAQNKRVNGYIYSFLTSVSQEDFRRDFDTPETILEVCVQGLGADNIKDFEISLEIGSKLYSVRFTANIFLESDTYDMQVFEDETGNICADLVRQDEENY